MEAVTFNPATLHAKRQSEQLAHIRHVSVKRCIQADDLWDTWHFGSDRFQNG
jgi:hypothetical protein